MENETYEEDGVCEEEDLYFEDMYDDGLPELELEYCTELKGIPKTRFTNMRLWN